MRALTIALALAANMAYAAPFTLSSTDLSSAKPIDNQFVFSGFGCTGKNISPALQWNDPPEGTKSFAVLVHDPDAPTGGAGWWHWLVLNLPADTRELAQGVGTADGIATFSRFTRSRLKNSSSKPTPNRPWQVIW